MSRFEGLLDTLREARRYVQSHPDEAIRLVESAREEIYRMHQERNDPNRLLFLRLWANLLAGIRCIRVDSDVLKGYITGTILEIQDYEARHK